MCQIVMINIDLFNWQLNLIGEKDEVPLHFCDKCGLPIQIYGRMVCSSMHCKFVISRSSLICSLVNKLSNFTDTM